MKEAIRRAIARQQEIHDLAEAENRELTEAETREYNNLQSIIDAANDETSASGADNQRGAEPNENREEGEQSGDNSDSASHPGERQQQGGYSPEESAEISNMCRHFGVDPAKYFSRGLTVQQVRQEIIQRQMDNQSPIGTGVEISADENDKFRQAAVDGILLRAGISVEKPAAGAENFRGMPLKDLAVESLEKSGGTEDYRHMNADRIFAESIRSFYNPEAAFPSILDEAIKKSYVEGLNKATFSYEKFCKFGTLTNFKKTQNHEYIMGLNGVLEEVPENGELKSYVPTDAKMPERQIKTHGRQFTMTRKAFIDDDIGMVTTMPFRFAQMSKRTQNKLVFDLLLGDKKIFDDKPLFTKDRKNLVPSGTGVTIDAIKKMIYMLGMQKDAAGNQLALSPDIIIVPLGMGVDVKTLLGSQYINIAEGQPFANPFYNAPYEIIEDVNINVSVGEGKTIPWFMGVKGETIEIDYLNGQKEATIRRMERPGTLGFVWDVYHDFAASVIHPETMIKNPGIIVTGD